MTKVIDSENKKPKPQRIVLPPAHDNLNIESIQNVVNHRSATTYKPSFGANPKNTYTAPVTTFHPKATSQTSSLETSATYINTNTKRAAPITTFHPKPATQTTADYLSSITKNDVAHKETEKFSSHYSEEARPFQPNKAPAMRPNVKDLLATIGLQPDLETTSTTAIPTKASTKASTAKPELTPELKDLLESFGLLTNEKLPSDVPGPYQEEFQPIFANAQRDNSLFVNINEFKPLPTAAASSPLPSTTTTTTTEPSKLRMHDPPEVKSVDFLSFKPLPIPDDPAPPSDDELEQLLKSYGLIDDGSRDKKSLEKDKEELDVFDDEMIFSSSSHSVSTMIPEKTPKMLNAPEVNVKFLPPNLMQVLDDIGIKNDKSNDSFDLSASGSEESENKTELPPSNNDYEKLHHLLDTIKQLDNLNANLTEKEFDSLNLRHYNLSDELLAQGPDPLDHLTGLDVSKNEIKRQLNDSNSDFKTESPEPIKFSLDLTNVISSTPKPVTLVDDDLSLANELNDDPEDSEKDDDLKDSVVSSTTASSLSTTDSGSIEIKVTITPLSDSAGSTTTTTTEEPRGGDADALADSFGGDGLDPVSEEPLPGPKRNGFYFFSDWNSFLEVGEDPDKVVVRFDPKIGDPSRFIPVKIP